MKEKILFKEIIDGKNIKSEYIITSFKYRSSLKIFAWARKDGKFDSMEGKERFNSKDCGTTSHGMRKAKDWKIYSVKRKSDDKEFNVIGATFGF